MAAKKTDPETRKRRIKDWFNPSGSNFMGTGLTFREFWAEGMVERFRSSWGQADREERKRRLGFIYELAGDRQRVMNETPFATRVIFDGAIEGLIEGSKREVHLSYEMTSFEGEDPSWADEVRNVYAPTRAILQRAVETWPLEPDEVVEEDLPPEVTKH